MQVAFDATELAPLIETIVVRVVAQLDRDREAIGERLAYTEPEAARLLSMEPHQLRDERRRGRIEGSEIVNRGVRYLRSDLLAYLGRKRLTQ